MKKVGAASSLSSRNQGRAGVMRGIHLVAVGG